MKMTNEFKTGAIVLAALMVTALFYVKTSNITSGAPYKIKTSFSYADGVKEDSIVKLSGIEIGRVTGIKFLYEPTTKVELTLTVNSVAKIHADAIAYIATSGMIGDAYIGLTPGSADQPYLKGGSEVASEDPVEARKLWKKAESIADNLDKTLVQVKELAGNLNIVVKDNKPKLDNIIANIEQTTVNFKDFSQDLKEHPWKLLMKGK